MIQVAAAGVGPTTNQHASPYTLVHISALPTSWGATNPTTWLPFVAAHGSSSIFRITPEFMADNRLLEQGTLDNSTNLAIIRAILPPFSAPRRCPNDLEDGLEAGMPAFSQRSSS